jgi:hypothetical protein
LHGPLDFPGGLKSEILVPLALLGFRLGVVGENTRLNEFHEDLAREKSANSFGSGISDIDNDEGPSVMHCRGIPMRQKPWAPGNCCTATERRI